MTPLRTAEAIMAQAAAPHHQHNLADISDAGALAALDAIRPTEIDPSAYATQINAAEGVDGTRIMSAVRTAEAIQAQVAPQDHQHSIADITDAGALATPGPGRSRRDWAECRDQQRDPRLGGDRRKAVLTAPEHRNYAETGPAPAISSGTLTLDLETGNVFEAVLTQNVTSLVLAHPPAAGRAGSCSIILRQDATGGRTLAWLGQVGGWSAAANHERRRCGRHLCAEHTAPRDDLVRFSRRAGLQLMLGVANMALRAAGRTWPKPSVDPVSRWEFDETSSAEGVFEDRGPAMCSWSMPEPGRT
jgi:hypothetical protein